jgi:PleD family two-component response regulator
VTQAGAFFIIKSQEKHNPKRNQAVIRTLLILHRSKKSVTDYLTGLNNRRGMEDYINKKWPEWIF